MKLQLMRELFREAVFRAAQGPAILINYSPKHSTYSHLCDTKALLGGGGSQELGQQALLGGGGGEREVSQELGQQALLGGGS